MANLAPKLHAFNLHSLGICIHETGFWAVGEAFELLPQDMGENFGTEPIQNIGRLVKGGILDLPRT